MSSGAFEVGGGRGSPVVESREVDETQVGGDVAGVVGVFVVGVVFSSFFFVFEGGPDADCWAWAWETACHGHWGVVSLLPEGGLAEVVVFLLSEEGWEEALFALFHAGG